MSEDVESPTRWVLDADVTLEDPDIQALLEGHDPGSRSEGFEPHAFEIPVGSDSGLIAICKKRCCRCGAEARRSELHLTRGERRFFCEACR